MSDYEFAVSCIVARITPLFEGVDPEHVAQEALDALGKTGFAILRVQLEQPSAPFASVCVGLLDTNRSSYSAGQDGKGRT